MRLTAFLAASARYCRPPSKLQRTREGANAEEARQDRRRVKELERELHRKDKALAETAALLVLSKKLSAVFHQGEDA
jgi:hypothetical protein